MKIYVRPRQRIGEGVTHPVFRVFVVTGETGVGTLKSGPAISKK